MRSLFAKLTGFLRWVADFVRWLVAPGDLERSVPGDQTEQGERREGFLTWVFAAESLAEDAETDDRPTEKRGALRSLLSPDRLPEEPDARAQEDPPPSRGGVSVGWLLRREHLDTTDDRVPDRGDPAR